MQPNGITFTEDSRDRFVPQYVIPAEGNSLTQKLYYFFRTDYGTYDYVTSQSVFIKAAKVINAVADKLSGQAVSDFNIGWLGAIYIAVFVWSIYLILRYIRRHMSMAAFWASSAVMLFMFCDQGYMLYFNSFYGEAVQYILTFCVIGLFLNLASQPRAGFGAYAAYYAVVVAMGMSKYAYAVTGVFFSILPIALLRKVKFPKWRLFAGSIVCSAALLFFLAELSPAWITHDTNFNAVFNGVLRGSKTPQEDLKDLGLDPSYAALQGYETYKPSYPIDITSGSFKQDFYGKISKAALLKFYLTHPRRLLQELNTTAKYSGSIRAAYLSNVQQPDEPHQQSERFVLWEKLRQWLPFDKLPFIAAVFLISGVVIIYEAIRCGKVKNFRGVALVSLFAAIVCSAGVNFAVPYMSNGFADLAKHMLGFIYLFDLMVCAVVGYAAYRIKRLFIRRSIAGSIQPAAEETLAPVS
jgi:hypothetical protein